MTGYKETACTTCAHREVCKLKDEFLNAQSAVDDVTVTLGENRFKKLRDFDWITAVTLHCKHYLPKMEVTLK